MEIIAVILTLLCVFLLNKQNILGWPFGVVAAGLYLIIFWKSDLIFQSSLQFIYILQSIYGWLYWKLKVQDNKVVKWKNSTVLTHILLIVGVSISLMYYVEVLGIELNLLDVITTSLAIYANYLLSEKVLQSWYIWILVNILLIPLMISQELWWTVGLYSILLLNSIHASITWNKNYEKI